MLLRKLRIDLSAILILLLYLLVVFIRFLRTFFSDSSSLGNRFSPLQVGINIVCHTLISLTMYHFVFEMQAERIQIEGGGSAKVYQRTDRNNKAKFGVISLLILQLVIYLTIRLMSEEGSILGTLEISLLILSIFLKLALDCIAFYVFISAFRFFTHRKRASLKREALPFSPFNRFILASVYALLALRVLGTLFTFTNAIVSLTSSYHDHGYSMYRLFMGDILFPIRDCIEAMYFSYLFYFQSTRRPAANMKRLNEQYFDKLRTEEG